MKKVKNRQRLMRLQKKREGRRLRKHIVPRQHTQEVDEDTPAVQIEVTQPELGQYGLMMLGALHDYRNKRRTQRPQHRG